MNPIMIGGLAVQEVRCERRGSALWLTIDREERRNALNAAVLEGLRAGVATARTEEGIRAIIITGAGKAFCAGADLKADAHSEPFRSDPAEVETPIARLFRAIVDCAVPVIARVNGHALAGGFGLVCACDFAVAVEGAKFGTPESRIGLFPMMILPWMLRTVPRRKLLEMCVTGEPITAAEALAHGILNHVVAAEKLDEKVEQLVASIAASSPASIRMGRRAMAMMDGLPLDKSLEYAQRVLPQMVRTEDAREGVRAFNEKRAPVWSGR